jgi:hypothetical protein
VRHERTLEGADCSGLLGYFVVLIVEILQTACEFVSVFFLAFLESVPE